MIALTPKHESVWKASDGELEIYYDKSSQYVDGTALCKRVRMRHGGMLDMWLNGKSSVICMVDDLRDRGFEPTKVITYAGNVDHVFIHPTLAPHWAMWLEPKLNYQMCKLMEAIVVDATVKVVSNAKENCKAMAVKPPKPITHSFTFYKLANGFSSLLQYYAVECPTNNIEKRTRRFRESNPHAYIIFQQHEIPNSVNVMRDLKKDWREWSHIVVGKDNYCGTDLGKVELCDVLRDYCGRSGTPTICSAYDAVDDGYEQV